MEPPRAFDYAQPLTPAQIEAGEHRRRAGGMWDSLGRKQLDYLLSRGLRPEHRLLDVGCGALRAGTHFAEYLEPAHYYGIDINQSMLDAGYDRELPAHLQEKLPRENLRATARFEVDFGVTFDYAVAQSLFTHVPLNHVRLCLYRVAKVMVPGGRFFATFFEAPGDFPLDQARPGERDKWTERNPFFYYRRDLAWAARFSSWEFRYLGDWGHPRGQQMVEFRRPDPAAVVPAGRVRRAVRRLPGARNVYATLRR